MPRKKGSNAIRGLVPGKVFYKIGDVSRISGLEPYVLRYWETEFPILHPRKNRGGQRAYQVKDIETVLRIKRMLYEEGYTISGARRQLAKRAASEETRGSRTTPNAVVNRVRSELKDLLSTMSVFDTSAVKHIGGA